MGRLCRPVCSGPAGGGHPFGTCGGLGSGRGAAAISRNRRARTAAACAGLLGLDGRGGADRDLIEAARLGIYLLDGDLQIVAFSDKPVASPTYCLKSQRGEAVQFIENLKADGGTRYLPPLRLPGTRPIAVGFISDGQPDEGEDAILDYLRRNVRCPMHTIAMTTSAGAEQLLAKMAAVTGGGFYRVRQPVGVIEAFLRMLGQVRGFRR